MPEEACGNQQKIPWCLISALTIPAMWAKMNSVFNRGPVAQLGARFHGMEEVAGSIPARSTKSPALCLPFTFCKAKATIGSTLVVLKTQSSAWPSTSVDRRFRRVEEDLGSWFIRSASVLLPKRDPANFN